MPAKENIAILQAAVNITRIVFAGPDSRSFPDAVPASARSGVQKWVPPVELNSAHKIVAHFKGGAP